MLKCNTMMYGERRTNVSDVRVQALFTKATVFLLCWMLLITRLSAQPAKQSNNLSLLFTAAIVNAASDLCSVEMTPQQKAVIIRKINNALRKAAHAFNYFVLGCSAYGALGVGRTRMVVALGFCVLFAAVDEIHQLFVPGRGGQWSDVLLDSASAWGGLLLCWAINRSKGQAEPKLNG